MRGAQSKYLVAIKKHLLILSIASATACSGFLFEGSNPSSSASSQDPSQTPAQAEEPASSPTPNPVVTNPPSPQIILATGFEHSCTSKNGALKCWGRNLNGSLGIGDANPRGDQPGEMGSALPYVQLGNERKVKSLSLGESVSCAVLDNDLAKCWGINGSGKLGTGSEGGSKGDAINEMGDDLPYLNFGTGRSVKELSIKDDHGCAILDNQQLKCWGAASAGCLGNENYNVGAIGDAPNEMGDALLPVKLGTNRLAVQITTGIGHSCAVLDNGLVKCWGSNIYGQLGYGDTSSRGGTAGSMGDTLGYVNLGSGRTVKRIAAGGYHTCAILDNDQVKCWGFNNSGQLGTENTTNYGSAQNQMGDSLPFVNLGTGRSAKAITAGRVFTCALLDNDKVKCFGHGGNGQLANGSAIARGFTSGSMGDALPYANFGTNVEVKLIKAGDYQVCALLKDDQVKCAGKNTYGDLGLGNITDQGMDNTSVGDLLPFVDLGF